MSMAFGFAEILMLAVLSGGIGSTDLVSLVQPTHYFQTRQIDVTIDKMVELASRDPKDAKTQIQQLVALRHLADETDSLKKATNYPAHRQALEQIAQGKKGADPLGFAQDYAQRVLGKLDGVKRTPIKTRPLREDALSWFPADATLAFAIDTRPAAELPNDPLKELLKLLPEREKKAMYGFIEKSGNVRVERIAFAYVPNDKAKFFVRFSGKANQTWLADMFQTLSNGRFESKKMKDAGGVPIIVFTEPKRPFLVMFGNHDVVFAGYNEFSGDHGDLLPEILDVRAKKKPNATAGVLKNRLAKIPDKAVAFGVGEFPKELVRDLRNVFDPPPSNITAFIERAQTGMDVQVETTMANRDDADKLVGKIGALRKQGIAGLQEAMKMPLPPDFPPIPFQTLINTLEGLQVQSDADKVQTRLIVPDTLIQQAYTLGAMFFTERKIEKK